MSHDKEHRHSELRMIPLMQTREPTIRIGARASG